MVMRRDDDDDNITAISSIAIAPISSSFAASSSCRVLYKTLRQGPELWEGGGTRCCCESDEISVTTNAD